MNNDGWSIKTTEKLTFARSVLSQKRELRRATRATGQPNNQRVGARLGSGFEKPEKVVLVQFLLVNTVVTRHALDSGVAKTIDRVVLETNGGARDNSE